MAEAWTSGLTTHKLLMYIPDLVKAGSPARAALEEQRSRDGIGFSSFKEWVILLQRSILTKEAILEYSRKFKIQQQGSRTVSQWHQYLITGRKFLILLAKAPRIDRQSILVMFMSGLKTDDRLRDKMTEKHLERHGHSFHECPAYLSRQRLIEMVQLAQEVEVKIHTKNLASSRHRSSPSRDSFAQRHQGRLTSALDSDPEADEAYLQWAAADPSKKKGFGTPRTPQQEPVGNT